MIRRRLVANSAAADGDRADLLDRGTYRYKVSGDEVQGFIEDQPYDVNKANLAEFIKTHLRLADK